VARFRPAGIRKACPGRPMLPLLPCHRFILSTLGRIRHVRQLQIARTPGVSQATTVTSQTLAVTRLGHTGHATIEGTAIVNNSRPRQTSCQAPLITR
jgi:hypothetical protein